MEVQSSRITANLCLLPDIHHSKSSSDLFERVAPAPRPLSATEKHSSCRRQLANEQENSSDQGKEKKNALVGLNKHGKSTVISTNLSIKVGVAQT